MIDFDFVINTPTPATMAEGDRLLNDMSPSEQAERWKTEQGYLPMGTDKYYKPLNSDWVYTDGVRRMAETFNAWWLVDELISHDEGMGRMYDGQGGSIQFARITSENGNAVIEYYDDSSEEYPDRVVTWTAPYGSTKLERANSYTISADKSLPVDEIVFCRQNNVVYLLAER